jgi:uncharacterized membrane protein YccF (DUF307 family)
MQTQTIVVPQRSGPGLLIRALYFVLVGWWLSGIWAVVAWLLSVTIIGLPFGLYMLNRLPQVVTLRPNQSTLMLTESGRVVEVPVRQRPFLLRAIYFVLVGWWLSLLWVELAWLASALIFGLPLGFLMFERVGTIATLADT